MSGKSRDRLAPVLTEASSWTSDRSALLNWGARGGARHSSSSVLVIISVPELDSGAPHEAGSIVVVCLLRYRDCPLAGLITMTMDMIPRKSFTSSPNGRAKPGHIQVTCTRAMSGVSHDPVAGVSYVRGRYPH